MYFFFTLWKILLPIGQITELGFSPHGNSGFSFKKIIETSSYGNQFLFLENLGVGF
jgi:hypothetical protein